MTFSLISCMDRLEVGSNHNQVLAGLFSDALTTSMRGLQAQGTSALDDLILFMLREYLGLQGFCEYCNVRVEIYDAGETGFPSCGFLDGSYVLDEDF